VVGGLATFRFHFHIRIWVHMARYGLESEFHYLPKKREIPMTAAEAALTKLIEALKTVKPKERRRTVEAAMTFLGEEVRPAGKHETGGINGGGDEAGDGDYPTAVSKWMKQNGVVSEELDRVFDFRDGGFVIHDVPGKSNREKTVNVYILTGLGAFLTTNNRTFGDASARGFCETIGCYDLNNHANTIRLYGPPAFNGTKKKGYTLTNVGVKRGAELVKELAGAPH
jgi:hypothetical protein